MQSGYFLNYIHPRTLPLLKEKNKGGMDGGKFSSYLVKGVKCVCGRFFFFFVGVILL